LLNGSKPGEQINFYFIETGGSYKEEARRSTERRAILLM